MHLSCHSPFKYQREIQAIAECKDIKRESIRLSERIIVCSNYCWSPARHQAITIVSIVYQVHNAVTGFILYTHHTM